MPKQAIQTQQAPAAIGPYSQAILSGHMLFISGQVGIDPKTKDLVPGGIEAQARQVLANIEALLKAAGAGLEGVVKTTIFIKDMSLFKTVNAIYAEYFREPFPARATVAVRDLPLAAEIEIDAIAVI